MPLWRPGGNGTRITQRDTQGTGVGGDTIVGKDEMLKLSS